MSTVIKDRWFATIAKRLLLFVSIVTVMTSSHAWAFLISVDLESSFPGESQPFSGVDPEAAAADAIFSTANIWNHLGTTGFQVVNPSFQNLVDSNGINTGVSFSITGSISAFGFSNPTDALLSDYICWNCVDNPGTIDWTIANLTPSTAYRLFFNGSHSDAATPRQFSMLVDTNGDGSLADEVAQTVVSPPGTLFSSVFSDVNGRITGRGIATEDEANWGGFQLALLPNDNDEDGVPNDEDECPDSDLSATVVIDSCNSGVPNTLFPSGCTISDLIAACAEDASNHGQFVSCVDNLTDDLQIAGTITGRQKGAIQRCAARADIP